MARRILVIAAILIVAGFLYLGYTSYDAGRSGANGDVFSVDSNSKSEAPRSHLTPTAPETSSAKPLSSQSASVTPQDSTNSVAPEQGAQPGVAVAGVPAPPATDTISPDPPNGMVFSGTGHFQLYRQGNLTWRLNTDTGQSCVLFATDEEWKKPRVLNAGCGKPTTTRSAR
jgi:hypothetical protein